MSSGKNLLKPYPWQPPDSGPLIRTEQHELTTSLGGELLARPGSPIKLNFGGLDEPARVAATPLQRDP